MAFDLPTDHLRTFVTIADCGSFTKAAALLHRTQPAVSMQMKRLEEQLGTPLLTRRGRQTTLTEAGALLHDYARRILDLNEQAVRKFAAVEAEGNVRIGIFEEVALGPLVDLLTKFGALCTKIHLELVVSTSADLARRIETGELCLAVANASYASGDIETLWHEPYVWACSPLFEGATSDPVSIVTEPLTTGCSLRDGSLRRLEASGRPWQVVFSSGSLAAVQSAVRAGLGVGWLPKSAVLPEFRILGEAEGFPEIGAARIGLYQSTKSDSDAARVLAEFLCEHLRQPEDTLALAS
ncbi:MAG: LysR substrate-binding domain-containing protein [Bacteroidota bacterium]